jgi:hypothetical protein
MPVFLTCSNANSTSTGIPVLDASMLYSCAEKGKTDFIHVLQHLRRLQMLLAFLLPQSDVNMSTYTPSLPSFAQIISNLWEREGKYSTFR